MTLDTRGPELEGRLRAVAGTALLILAAGAGILFADPIAIGALLGVVAMLYLFRAVLFSWPGAAVGLILIICLVPARRYTLPITLPFAAEPYRLYVLALLAIMIVALLIDPKFSWRRLEFAAPVGIFLATQLLSIGANVPGLVAEELAPNAVQALVSLLIICAMFVVTRQLLRSRRMVHLVVMTAVGAGALVGLLAMIERVTRVNVFLGFFSVLPLHRLSEEESVFVKAGTARAFASAQHPIALAVFLCMLIPLGIYLARNADWPHRPVPREFLWLGCTVLIALGMIAAVSRTSIVSLAVMTLAALLLRPALLPKVVLYGGLALLAAFVISSRNIISMVTELTDPQALIESQQTSPGWTGSGRLADLGPSLQQAMASPVVGTGLGSRVTTGDTANALILDDQYLTTLLESGIVGVLGIVILMLVPFGRLAKLSRRIDVDTDKQDLALAVAVSILGYSVSLFFFDAFSFIQTLLMFFVLLAIGSWLVAGDKLSRLARRALEHEDEEVLV